MEEEEEGIKTFRRENNKIAEEGINKVQEGKMWWWLYIVSLFTKLCSLDEKTDLPATFA